MQARIGWGLGHVEEAGVSMGPKAVRTSGLDLALEGDTVEGVFLNGHGVMSSVGFRIPAPDAGRVAVQMLLMAMDRVPPVQREEWLRQVAAGTEPEAPLPPGRAP